MDELINVCPKMTGVNLRLSTGYVTVKATPSAKVKTQIVIAVVISAVGPPRWCTYAR